MTTAIRTILIIDDSIEDQQIVRRLLAGVGDTAYAWVEAQTGADGLAALGGAPVDAVLLDYSLPDMTGIDVLTQLGAGATRLPVPVVMLTGAGSDGLADEALRRGAQDYLRKDSLSSETLRLALSNAIIKHDVQRSLDQQEQRLSRILEQISDGFVAIDRDWRFTYANPRAAELLQCPRERLTGASIWERFAVAAGTVVEREFRRSLEQDEPVTFEIFDPGQQLWLELRAQPSTDGLTVYMLDISERKRAGEALRLSEERFRNLSLISPVGVFRTDPAGRCLYVNERWSELTGLTLTEARNEGWMQALHPDDRRRVVREWHLAVKASQQFASEYRFVRPDGRLAWVFGQSVADRDADGTVLGHVGTITDITDRVLTEQALREREQQLAGVIETMADGLVIIDREGRFALANAAAERIFGVPREQVIGARYDAPPWERLTVEGAPFPMDDHPFARLRTGTATDAAVDFTVVQPGGRQVVVSLRSMPLRDPACNFAGIIASMTDVTDRIAAEQALRDSEEFSRSVIESSPDCVKILDLDGRLLSMNGPGLCIMEIDDFTPMIGQPWRSFWPKESHDAVRDALGAALRGETGEFRAFCPTAKGTPRWWDVQVAPVRQADGAIVRLVSVSRDITAQHRADEALRLRDQALAATSSGILITDARRPDQPIVYVNPAFGRLTGYRSEEVIGRNCRFLQGPATDPATVATLRAALVGGEECHVTLLNYRKDGTPFWNDLHVSPVLDSAGHIAYFVGVQIDVTSVRRTQEQLRLSEERLRMALEASKTGIFDWSVGDDLIVWSENMYRNFGVSPETFTPTFAAFIALVHSGDRERVAQTVQQALAGECDYDIEFRVLRPDGTVRWAAVTAEVHRDSTGQAVRMIGADHDITERKQAEERQRFLSDATAILAASLDASTMLTELARLAVPMLADRCMIDIVDADQTVRRVAVACADPAKQALAEQLMQFPPNFWEAEGASRVLRTGRPVLHGEVTPPLLDEILRGDEHRRIVSALGATAYLIVPLSSAGKTIGVMTFVSAESGRRYGPDDQDLATELARRTSQAAENARLYHDVQQAVQLRDEFISSISHDLRTPLTTIRGNAQMARRRTVRLEDDTGGFLTNVLDEVVGGTVKMERMIDDLLDLTRLQAGQSLDLRLRPADLVTLVRGVVIDQQRTTDRHRLLLETALDQLPGEWDPGRVERILGNLLSNAIKYSPAGGEVVVTVRREQDAAGKWAVVAVRDSGMGIPAADLPHVFERFHRAGNVRGQVLGNGIGLAGALQIAVQHGGTITATSTEGAGSTFTVRLPLAPE